ncbi:epoxyqueuosine reductase QueH [Desulfofalx alkaliphila]|uniref:epoxyqueuosine reductase QueH n=1 Tax=Desulfofalx alkaliphila TaxID=105483 RepID=UPI0004E23F8C|nr:epoxyqueuosine reductase QueH [Desulfofalx alkaliphila]
MPKILLHSCCGPCTIYPLEHLLTEEFTVMAHFYNPNIHPYTEWQKRKENFRWFADHNHLKAIIEDDYDLEGFLQRVVHRETTRCRYCYWMRLNRTAQLARKGKFDAFTTTLLVSPFQKHNLIKEIGEEVGEKYGVPFYYADFRPGFKDAYMKAKETGHYRQQYCGCIYSEKERYMKKGEK